MPTTPIYGLPYPALSDPPNGPAQIQALAEGVESELQRIDATADTDQSLLSGFTSPTQTGSGTLVVGGNGAVIMTVVIPNPGFQYYVVASASLGWAVTAGASPGNLLIASITLDSTVYSTNVLRWGFGVSHSLSAGFSQQTIHVSPWRSDGFGAFSGSHTVRLIARYSGPASSATIPAASSETSLFVRIVRV